MHKTEDFFCKESQASLHPGPDTLSAETHRYSELQTCLIVEEEIGRCTKITCQKYSRGICQGHSNWEHILDLCLRIRSGVQCLIIIKLDFVDIRYMFL